MFNVLKVFVAGDRFRVELEQDNKPCAVDLIINESDNLPYGAWTDGFKYDYTDEDLNDALGTALCYLENNDYVYCDEDYNWHYNRERQEENE